MKPEAGDHLQSAVGATSGRSLRPTDDCLFLSASRDSLDVLQLIIMELGAAFGD